MLNAFGECLPDPENRVTIDPSVKDAWGIPVARMQMSFGANERALHADAVAAAGEMLEIAGAKNVGVAGDMALTARAAHHAADLLASREL